MPKKSSLIGVVILLLLVGLMWYNWDYVRLLYYQMQSRPVQGPEIDKNFEALLRKRDKARADVEEMRQSQSTYMAGGEKDWETKMNNRILALQDAEAAVAVFPDAPQLPRERLLPDGTTCKSGGNFEYDYNKLIVYDEKDVAQKRKFMNTRRCTSEDIYASK